MSATRWVWAELTPGQVDLIVENERTLGVDILMAFHPSAPDVGMSRLPYRSLRVAPLDETQMKRLMALEESVQAVVVAYQRSRPAG